MTKPKEDIGEKLIAWMAESGKKARKSPYLKQRVDIRCVCKRQKQNERDRVKYGTCRCDSFSMFNTLGHVIANYLYQYLADASNFIERDDWEVIEKHAKAIREYNESNSWDLLSKEKGVKSAFVKKEKAFKEAMKWLVNNWGTLWW